MTQPSSVATAGTQRQRRRKVLKRAPTASSAGPSFSGAERVGLRKSECLLRDVRNTNPKEEVCLCLLKWKRLEEATGSSSDAAFSTLGKIAWQEEARTLGTGLVRFGKRDLAEREEVVVLRGDGTLITSCLA